MAVILNYTVLHNTTTINNIMVHILKKSAAIFFNAPADMSEIKALRSGRAAPLAPSDTRARAMAVARPRRSR